MREAELLREILDAQLEMVCRFARDGTILFVNRAYADTLGLAPAALIGRNLWDFVSEGDRRHVEQSVARLSPDFRTVTIENRFETAGGTRWTLWRNVGLCFDEAGNWLEAQSSGYDITERKALEEQRELLVSELNHRVRNTLMVVQGMAQQTFRGTDMPPEPLAAFNARLHALAAAHTALAVNNWSGAELSGLVRQAVAICGGETERIEVAGPDVVLPPGAVVALVLVLHELATNALKHGALSADAGSIALAWQVAAHGEGKRMELTWRERGGPPVGPPTRTGFGSRLIATSIRQQLGGELAIDHSPQGLVCHMAFPLHGAGA